jgi:hypothetical protein
MKNRRSWKTTLGGSLSAFGTFLMGATIVPSLPSMAAAESLKWFVVAGFILQGLGTFFGQLFAADQTAVMDMIEKSGGDTQWSKKSDEP